MPKQKLLRAWANPFACELDHEGRPHGRIQYEPDPINGDASLRWVGCRVVATLVRKANTRTGHSEAHDHAFEYALEPAVLADTDYYRRALTHHPAALLAADIETHAAVFGTREGFVNPLLRLAQLASERGAVPALQASAEVQAAIAAATAKGAPSPERDREAEWASFLAPAFAKKTAPARADSAPKGE